MRIADEAEARFARKVAWGARCGDEEELFTTLSVPVMTRLRLPERQVLDTLVDAGVARSRSHALAWCVRLVGDHEGDWIDQLRDALVHVEKVRERGPGEPLREAAATAVAGLIVSVLMISALWNRRSDAALPRRTGPCTTCSIAG